MKNKYIYLMLMAAAVVASCVKENVASIEENSVSGLVFSSEKPAFSDETKTAWTGTSVQWSKGDRLRVAYTCDDVWQNAAGTATADEANGKKTAKMYQSTALAAASEIAQFNVPTDFKGNASGIYKFYALYPDTCVPLDFKYAPSASVTIPNTQTPAADSFDSSADIMLGESVGTYTGLPTEAVSIRWNRLVAHAQFTFKAINGFTDGETVKSISLTANTDADMVGLHYVDVLTESVTKPNSNTTANVLTISGDNLTAVSVDGAYNVVAWASFLPCTVTSLNVVLTTDKATYTREISDISLAFLQNARNTLTVNMSGAVRNSTGAGKSLPFNEDFSLITTGNSTTSGGSGSKVTPEQMSQFSSYVDATYQAGNAIRIGKSGCVETMPLDLSDAFSVIVSAKGWSDKETVLTVSAGAKSQDIQLTTWMSGEYQQYILTFDAVGASGIVKFATSSSVRCFIDDIQILSGHAALPPTIVVADTDKPSKVDAAGDVVTIPYTIKNPVDGISIVASVPEGITWINTFDYAENEISFVVDENTESTERSSVVTLSYEGAESVEIPIVQKAAGSTGVETKTFKISSGDVVNDSKYTNYSATVDTRSWLITYGGNNSSVGTSNKQRKNCTLSSYSKYAVSPVTASSTASVFAATSKLSNVTGISYGAITGKNHANTKIYVIYSADDKTYSQIELTEGSQGSFNKEGGTFKFASLSGYFAVIFQATNTTGDWRLDDVSLTFTYTE